MKNKIDEILNSARFWMLTSIAILMILQYYNVLNSDVIKIIEGWIAAVFGVGTLDSVATKIGGKK